MRIGTDSKLKSIFLFNIAQHAVNLLKVRSTGLLVAIKGHSKKRFAKDSRVLIPPAPCSLLFVFKHRPPPRVRSFWLKLTFSGSMSILELNVFFKGNSWISIKWTPLAHVAWQKSLLYGAVHFIESLSKNQMSSKVNKVNYSGDRN